MDPALLSIFVLLQFVLAPILYPFGYIAQSLLVLASGWRKFSLGEIEWSLIECLFLVALVCNMVNEENITVAGYATRAGILLFRLYQSPRLQNLSLQIMEPVTSCFLLIELIASPHLYPVGYLAQLALIFFLAFSGSLQVLSLLLLSSRKQFQKQFDQHFGSVDSYSNMNHTVNDHTLRADHRTTVVNRASPGTASNEKGFRSPIPSSKCSAKKSSLNKSKKLKRKVSPNKPNPAVQAIQFCVGVISSLLSPPSPSRHFRPPSLPSTPVRGNDEIPVSGGGEDHATDDALRPTLGVFPYVETDRNTRLLEDDSEVHESREELQEDVDEEEEEEEEEDLFLCKICFEGRVTTAFVSCGHVCCRKCCDTLTSEHSRMVCPFCQKSVMEKIDIFFP